MALSASPVHHSLSGPGVEAGKAAAESTGQLWRFRAPRHANATYTIFPEVDGGQGKQHVEAAEWAGHNSPAYLFHTYVDRVMDGIRASNTTLMASGEWDKTY